MSAAEQQRLLWASGARAEALERELGLLVDPSAVGIRIRPVSMREFLAQVERVALLLGTVDTSRTRSLRFKLFIMALYARPPRLAFVEARLRRGVGRATVLSGGRRYDMVFDGLSHLLGPRTRVSSTWDARVVLGHYVPVSTEYLVTPRPVEGATPEYRVTDGKSGATWYVYRAAENPVPHNIAAILTL